MTETRIGRGHVSGKRRILFLIGLHNVADGMRGPIDVDQSDDFRAVIAVQWDDNNSVTRRVIFGRIEFSGNLRSHSFLAPEGFNQRHPSVPHGFRFVVRTACFTTTTDLCSKHIGYMYHCLLNASCTHQPY